MRTTDATEAAGTTETTRLARSFGLAVLVSLMILVAPGCSSRNDQAGASARPSSYRDGLKPVSLPDMTRAAPSVREQVRERYAGLKERVDDPSASTADLGAAYGEMGKLFMAAELRDSAEVCFHNAEALAPTDIRWPYYLGQLYKIRGDMPESTAAFQRALKLQPNDVPTLVWLGDEFLAQDKPDSAEPLFVRAVSLQPQSVAAFLGLGRTALARQDYGRAVQHLERALTIDPHAAIVHYPLAMAFRGLGDRQKAEAHLQQRGTVQVKPEDPLMKDVEGLLHSTVAYEMAGVDALDRGDVRGATETFRKAIALAPNDPSLHHKLGTALALSGDPRGAFQEFHQTIRLSPKFAKAHYSLGVMMAANGEHQKAIDELETALKAQPAYVEARLQLANELRRGGRLAESLHQYAEIITGDPRVAEARFGYAASLIRLERYGEARAQLAEAMSLYPNEVAFPRVMARLLAAAPDDRVRDGGSALSLARMLLETQPRTVDLLETMAMASAEVGQYGDAVMWQREAIAAAHRAGRHDIGQLIADDLQRYEARRPCRTPWRPEEPIEFTGPTIGPDASRS